MRYHVESVKVGDSFYELMSAVLPAGRRKVFAYAYREKELKGV